MLPRFKNHLIRPIPVEDIMPTASAPTDAVLLERFISRQDLAAFEIMVRRHGPMVYQVCQRVLHHPQDAEDAFQATFVVLVKKARAISRPELLGGWLHGVAARIAMKARSQSAQRQSREKPLTNPAAPGAAQSSPEPGWGELRPVLDEELNRLPEKYRAPLVLCYLEGKTNDQAAAQLGWSRGKVAGKLSRGRDLLRNRLTRRGLTLSSAVLGALLIHQTASAAVLPAALKTAALHSTGEAAVSASVKALAEGVAVGNATFSAKAAVASVLAVIALAGGVAYLLQDRKLPEPPAMVFQSFDGPNVPRNRAGQSYPNPYDKADGGGQFTANIQSDDAVAGSCLRMRLTSGWLKAQFDPDDARTRGFARDYCARPEAWRFNTYNRLRFWVKLPAADRPYPGNGQNNMSLGAYVKREQGADPLDALAAYYHQFNVPATGRWTQVVLNMHPHFQGRPGQRDLGNQPHPTGELDRNYFDALSRMFIEARSVPKQYPADYFLDEMEFFHERFAENDEQVYSITATHVPEEQRIILTWNRHQSEDAGRHEVRYAFRNIHEIGWDQAEPAPRGLVRPLGAREANGMAYDSTELPLQGQPVLYLAIKPENAALFSQVAIRLTRK